VEQKFKKQFIKLEIRTLIIVLYIANIGLVKAQYTAIPDNCFEQHLIDLGIDSEGVLDGQVLTSDINTITELTMNGTDINNNDYGCYIDNLQGIADFIALETLNINTNGVQHIDVSSLPNLKNLYCDNNYTQILALPPSIEIVYARFNRYSQNVDLSQTINLKEIHLDGFYLSDMTHITTINTNNCPNLIELTADFNDITNLDTSNNFLLENLSIINRLNQVFTSFTHNNPNLKHLAIAGALTSFNCDEMTNLEQVQLLENKFTNLSFVNNINLIDVRIGGSSLLEKIDIRNNHNDIINLFSTGDNPNLTCIYVDNTQYSQVNWTNVNDLNYTFVETEAECNTLSIEEENASNNFIKIYPNPTNDILHILNSIDNTVEIYNLLGKMILKKELSDNKMSLKFLKKGIYFLKIKTYNGFITRKIVKI